MHIGQRGVQRGRVVQGHSPVRQAELPGQRGDGRRGAPGEDGPVPALVGVLGDQGAGVAGGAVEHPRACLAHGACSIAVGADVVWHRELLKVGFVVPRSAGAAAAAVEPVSRAGQLAVPDSQHHVPELGGLIEMRCVR